MAPASQVSSRDIKTGRPDRVEGKGKGKGASVCMRSGGHLRGVAYHTGVDEGVLEVCVACKELLVEKRGVLEIAEERSVDGVRRRQVFEMDGVERHGDTGAVNNCQASRCVCLW